MTLTKDQIISLSTQIIETISHFASIEKEDLTVKDALYCLDVTKEAVIQKTVIFENKEG